MSKLKEELKEIIIDLYFSSPLERTLLFDSNNKEIIINNIENIVDKIIDTVERNVKSLNLDGLVGDCPHSELCWSSFMEDYHPSENEGYL